MAARRSYGTGSITRKGKGWLVRAERGTDPLTGKRVRDNKTVYGTKSDAQRVLDEINATRSSHRNLSSDVPLGQLILMWRSTVHHATGTERNYDNAFALLPTALTEAPARKATALTLDMLYASLLASGAAVDTVRYLHAGLGATYTQAHKWGLIASNPVRAATPPPKPQRSKKHLTRDISARVMAAAVKSGESLQVRAWLAVVLTTGARRSEVLALQWEDIDLDLAVVEIVTALDPTADAVALKATKGRDRRVLPLGPGTVGLLGAWRAAVDDRDRHVTPTSWVFSLNGDTPWKPNYATKKWRRVADRASVDLTLHNARSFVGTMASDVAGVNDKAVAGFLGHRDERVTHGYMRAMPDRAEHIARTLDDLLFRSES